MATKPLTEPAVHAERVSFSYGRLKVLDELSLEIPQGAGLRPLFLMRCKRISSRIGTSYFALSRGIGDNHSSFQCSSGPLPSGIRTRYLAFSEFVRRLPLSFIRRLTSAA